MKLLISTLALLSLAGCACKTLGPDHGVSTHDNVLEQTVDLKAETEGSTAQGMEGIAASDAIKQYKEADNKNRGERLVKDLSN